MVVRGHVREGRIELDEQVELPEGVTVEVNVLTEAVAESESERVPTLYERLEPLIGKLEGFPADFSLNHDHYLYGTPKRE
jgi:hypothetical protein